MPMWPVWEGKHKGIGLCFLHSLNVDEAADLHHIVPFSRDFRQKMWVNSWNSGGDTGIQGVRCEFGYLDSPLAAWGFV